MPPGAIAPPDKRFYTIRDMTATIGLTLFMAAGCGKVSAASQLTPKIVVDTLVNSLKINGMALNPAPDG